VVGFITLGCAAFTEKESKPDTLPNNIISQWNFTGAKLIVYLHQSDTNDGFTTHLYQSNANDGSIGLFLYCINGYHLNTNWISHQASNIMHGVIIAPPNLGYS
jgi:hypothetical protein